MFEKLDKGGAVLIFAHGVQPADEVVLGWSFLREALAGSGFWLFFNHNGI